jgi:gliding motility-associated-like protein
MKRRIGAVALLALGFFIKIQAQCAFTVQVQTDSVRCHGEANGSATAVVNGNTGPFQYTWNTNPPVQGPNATLNGLPAGFYTVSVMDTLGCIVNRPFVIHQPANMTANVGFDTTVCANEPVVLKSLVFGGIAPFTYSWSCNTPGGNCYLNNSNAAMPTIRPMENVVYYFQATDANGCLTTTDSVVVLVDALPTVDAGPDLQTYLSEPVQLIATASSAGSFQWSPAQGLDFTNIQSPFASPNLTTTYQVIFTDGNGCRDTSTAEVVVITDITIPTGLTPNGDMINDVWDVKNLVAYPNCHVHVYNRSGMEVFHSKGYAEPWTGGDHSAGTYFYIIDLGVEGAEILKGTITLIR